MKTPMQILISELEEGLKQDEIKVSPKELMQNLIWRCNGLLQKEKEVAQQYAEFAIECDRKELPVLEFDGWINL